MVDSYRVIVTPEADRDLNEILDYLAATSPGNASKVIERLLREIASLSLLPYRHSLQRHRRFPKNTHLMPLPPYRVIYRVLENPRVVRVLHVEHGARHRRP
jgi:plasmid stabilization system protein ParE